MTPLPTEHGDVLLRIPPEPQEAATARLFAAAVARMLGYEEDAVEDIRLAVSEAITDAIRLAALREDGRAAEVRFRIEPRRVTVEIAPAAGESASPSESGSSTLALVVIRSLFPDADLAGSGESITFALDRPAFEPEAK